MIPQTVTATSLPTNSKNTNQQLTKTIIQRYTAAQQSLKLYRCPLWKSILQKQNSPIDLSAIKILILSDNNINDDDFGVISQRKWVNVTQLWINCNAITSKSVHNLTKNTWPALQDLSLYENQIGNEGIFTLFDNDLPTLISISIGLNKPQNNKIPKDFIMYTKLTKNINPQALPIKKLDLKNNNMGAGGAKWLTKINIPQLTTLNVGQCNLGDNGARHLCKGNWHLLEDIDLGYNEISSTGFFYITNSNWKSLLKVNLYYNAMSAFGCVNMILLQAKKLETENICLWGIKNRILQDSVKKVIEITKPNSQKRRRGQQDFYDLY